MDAKEPEHFRQLVTCPFCHGNSCRTPAFTLWGGIYGTRMLHHRFCPDCGRSFNEITGTSNLKNILVYQSVKLVILTSIAAIGILVYRFMA